jgi:hypothetical protein
MRVIIAVQKFVEKHATAAVLSRVGQEPQL